MTIYTQPLTFNAYEFPLQAIPTGDDAARYAAAQSLTFTIHASPPNLRRLAAGETVLSIFCRPRNSHEEPVTCARVQLRPTAHGGPYRPEVFSGGEFRPVKRIWRGDVKSVMPADPSEAHQTVATIAEAVDLLRVWIRDEWLGHEHLRTEMDATARKDLSAFFSTNEEYESLAESLRRGDDGRKGGGDA